MPTIPTSHRRILFQSKDENPIIKPAHTKNYLTPFEAPNGRQKKVVVFDAEVEDQLYRKTILGE